MLKVSVLVIGKSTNKKKTLHVKRECVITRDINNSDKKKTLHVKGECVITRAVNNYDKNNAACKRAVCNY